jgi:hypothetical protein
MGSGLLSFHGNFSLTKRTPSQNQAQHTTHRLMPNQQAEMKLKSDHLHYLTKGEYGNSQIYRFQTMTTLFTGPWFNRKSSLPKILSSFM